MGCGRDEHGDEEHPPESEPQDPVGPPVVHEDVAAREQPPQG